MSSTEPSEHLSNVNRNEVVKCQACCSSAHEVSALLACYTA